MGASQSSGGGSDGASRGRQSGGDVKTCYYELLGIDPKASEEEYAPQISISASLC